MNKIDSFYKSLEEATEHQTRCSRAWLIGDDVIFVDCKENAEIELKDAIEDMELSEALVADVSYFATIIDTANIKGISKEARDWYSQVQNDNPRNVSVALIVNSFYTRIIANFFLGFKNSRTEMKIFNEKDDAIEWLYEQLEMNKSASGQTL
jgi:hypothetical protein